MKAGFSVTDLVILEKIPSRCDVPYEVMYFQLKCFEIIPTMMHLCCFLPTEKDFLINVLGLGIPYILQSRRHPDSCPKSNIPFAEYASAALMFFDQYVVSILLSYSTCFF